MNMLAERFLSMLHYYEQYDVTCFIDIGKLVYPIYVTFDPTKYSVPDRVVSEAHYVPLVKRVKVPLSQMAFVGSNDRLMDYWNKWLFVPFSRCDIDNFEYIVVGSTCYIGFAVQKIDIESFDKDGRRMLNLFVGS